LQLPKYFKNYHSPLAIELPRPHESNRLISCKIHSFGAVSLTYQIPFDDTLSNVRKSFESLRNQFQEQSVTDVKSVFKKIEPFITQKKLFHMQANYSLIQVNPSEHIATIKQLKEQLGGVIASMMRFETETLSEFQKNEILDSTLGYFRGDVLIVDTDASFIYDKEYVEVLDLFEFANIQQLELRYFDRLLDQQLNRIYEGEETLRPSWRTYMPFMGITRRDPMEALGKLKVDISVITERLGGSIKLAGEPYFAELYDLLTRKLDIKNWQQSIDRKLSIVHDIQGTYQHKVDMTRQDLLEVLIILLIFIEMIVGVLSYIKA